MHFADVKFMLAKQKFAIFYHVLNAPLYFKTFGWWNGPYVAEKAIIFTF